MRIAGQEIRNYAREQRAQARLDKAHDHLRALLKVEWAGHLSCCPWCYGIPSYLQNESWHESDCPRQAAQEYLDGLA